MKCTYEGEEYVVFMLLACKKDADKIDDGAIDSSFTGYSMEITEPQYGAFIKRV